MNYMKLLIIAVIISAALFPALVVGSRPVKCDNCIDGGEKEEIMKMSSGMDVSHRILQAKRYISYDALKKNKPAKPDGKPDKPDNKYRRGCTAATGCYRFTN
ncbi:Rapid ALkalinization Factor [Arabidopsis thaliana x Arabidopsis arenosa]|uniref:Rapid ALkalinization Factor n=1 Tax=Arabidopsis thaliana x Arabidopsis arenosa TaxID=1240361 RepID=A0A8T2A6H7_9BRAS|nr:Rapid ALkalinization Factor [Arabidopsis thaliana x Arabidopsis arenosa]